MGKVVAKLLSGAIGFTSEAIHAARSKSSDNVTTSSSSRDISNPEPGDYVVTDEKTANELVKDGRAEIVSSVDEKIYDSDEVTPGINQDEAVWQLDEAAHQVNPPTYSEAELEAAAAEPEAVKERREVTMVRGLVDMAGPIPSIQRLPCPVIIPQRRPGFKERGFVRAYAPVLADSGVSQDVFTKFLDDFDKASRGNPVMEVVFVAANLAGFAPELTVNITAQIISSAVGIALEIQTRKRRNNFLERVNREFFMPRGLFAMIMAFKDDVPDKKLVGLTTTLGKTLMAPNNLDLNFNQKTDGLDINQIAAKYSSPDPEMSKANRGLQNMRLQSGTTNGVMELPEAAPLVYPDLDRIESGERKTRLGNAGAWVSDYFDRKAQANLEYKHPGSSVVVPSSVRKPFASRYNDPSHAVNNGSLASVLTGGLVGKHSLCDRIEKWTSTQDPAKRKLNQQKPSYLRKVFVQDVLYLLIVNLPTAEEIQQSNAQLKQMGQ